MADNLDIFSELRAMRSRVEAIEHNTEILIRANSSAIVDGILTRIDQDPLLGHIYLLVDRKRAQRHIVLALRANGHSVASDATVSRRIDTLSKELHIIELVDHTRAGKVYGKTSADRILGLSRIIDRAIGA